MVDSVKKDRQAGFTLVEVLVALVILAIGLLGLAGLQVTGLRGSSSAYMRSAAMIYANDMVDRIRANRADAFAGNYDQTMAAGIPALAAPIPVADQDIADWLGALQQSPGRGGLPNGDGSIAVVGNLLTVTVQWADNFMGTGTASVSVVARL